MGPESGLEADLQPGSGSVTLVLCVLALLTGLRLALQFPLWYTKHRAPETPSLLERQPCRIVGHRGSRDEGLPENSIAAFKQAVENGAQVVEFDVWLTKDHVPVVFHDDTFDRMCGVGGSIPEVNYRDLPRLNPCYEQRFAIDKYSAEEALRIPTLEEVLQVVPEHVGMLVELKQNDWLLIDKVHSLLQQYHRRHNCVWFSLKEEINQKLAAKDPSIPRITSVPKMIRVLLAFYFGVLPLIPIEERILGFAADKVDYERIKHTAALHSFPDFVKRLLAAVFAGDPPSLMLNPLLFSHLRRRGMAIWVMGVNDKHKADIVVRAGATSLVTDCPSQIAKWQVEANPSFQEPYV